MDQTPLHYVRGERMRQPRGQSSGGRRPDRRRTGGIPGRAVCGPPQASRLHMQPRRRGRGRDLRPPALPVETPESRRFLRRTAGQGNVRIAPDHGRRQVHPPHDFPQAPRCQSVRGCHGTGHPGGGRGTVRRRHADAGGRKAPLRPRPPGNPGTAPRTADADGRKVPPGAPHAGRRGRSRGLPAPRFHRQAEA